MRRRAGAWLGLLAALLPPASGGRAQDTSAPGTQVLPSPGQTPPANGTLGFQCVISGAGHRWDVLATNSTGRSYQCSVACAFRAATGAITNASCTPTVQDGLYRASLCSGSDSASGWTDLAGQGTYILCQ